MIKAVVHRAAEDVQVKPLKERRRPWDENSTDAGKMQEVRRGIFGVVVSKDRNSAVGEPSRVRRARDRTGLG